MLCAAASLFFVFLLIFSAVYSETNRSPYLVKESKDVLAVLAFIVFPLVGIVEIEGLKNKRKHFFGLAANGSIGSGTVSAVESVSRRRQSDLHILIVSYTGAGASFTGKYRTTKNEAAETARRYKQKSLPVTILFLPSDPENIVTFLPLREEMARRAEEARQWLAARAQYR